MICGAPVGAGMWTVAESLQIRMFVEQAMLADGIDSRRTQLCWALEEFAVALHRLGAAGPKTELTGHLSGAAEYTRQAIIADDTARFMKCMRMVITGLNAADEVARTAARA
jgi:hypothetical protein